MVRLGDTAGRNSEETAQSGFMNGAVPCAQEPSLEVIVRSR